MSNRLPTVVVVHLSAEAAAWLNGELNGELGDTVADVVLRNRLIFHPAQEVLVAAQAAVMRQRHAVEEARPIGAHPHPTMNGAHA